MTSHAPDRMAGVVLRGRGACGYLLLGLLLLAFPQAGCSIFIYHGYQGVATAQGHSWEDFTAFATRGEVLEALGTPAEEFSCPDGTRVDRYHLPAKIHPCGNNRLIPGNAARGGSCTWWGNALDAFEVALVDMATLGLAELYMTPATIARAHEQEQWRGVLHVGFVYDPDNRVFYRYDGAPGNRDGMVLGPLTQQVAYVFDASDPPRCSRWRDCVGRGVAGMRRVATCLDYPLTPEVAQRVTWVERIAAEVDAERLTREAGRDALTACYLKPEGPCPLAAAAGPP